MPNDQNSLYMFTYGSYALQHIIIMNTLSWAHNQAQDTMHQFLYSSTSAVSIFHNFADSGWRHCSALCLGVAALLCTLSWGGGTALLSWGGGTALLSWGGGTALLSWGGGTALHSAVLGWRHCSALCCLGVAALLCTLLSWGGSTALLSWGGGTALHSAVLGWQHSSAVLGWRHSFAVLGWRHCSALCCLGMVALLFTLLSWDRWQNCSALRCPGVSTISMLQAAHEQQMIKESALTRVCPKARGKTPGASSANDSQGQPLLWVGDETDVAPVLCLFHVGRQL